MIKINNKKLLYSKINGKEIQKIIINKKQVWHKPEWHTLWEGDISCEVNTGAISIQDATSRSIEPYIDNSNEEYVRCKYSSLCSYEIKPELKFRITYRLVDSTISHWAKVMLNGGNASEYIEYLEDKR